MKKKRKQSFLKKNYSESFNYLRKSQNFIWIIVGLFLFSALIGFFIPAPESFTQFMSDYIEKILEQTKDFNSATDWISFLLMHNIWSSFLGVVLGIFFGILPLLFTLMNGYVVGFVSSVTVAESGFLILWRLVPHGIFELPALFISLGLGFKLGTFIFQKYKAESFRNYLLNSLRVFLLIVIPLLIIAAIIEGSLIFYS